MITVAAEDDVLTACERLCTQRMGGLGGDTVRVHLDPAEIRAEPALEERTFAGRQ
jgi:hypothetical protein